MPAALALADRDVAAVRAGRLEHAERHRVDVRDRERARLARRRGELGRRLEAAEEVRLLEDHRGRVVGGGGDRCRVGDAVLVRHLDDLEAEPRARTSCTACRTCGLSVSVRTTFVAAGDVARR